MTSQRAVVPPYEVISAELEAVPGSDGHEHVSFVATNDPDGGQTRWSVAQVMAAMQSGERFLVSSGGASGDVMLEPTICPTCGTATVTL